VVRDDEIDCSFIGEEGNLSVRIVMLLSLSEVDSFCCCLCCLLLCVFFLCFFTTVVHVS
jgi:hypothetical protein